MAEDQEIRIDKFLWAIRVFKTRTIATDACKKGWIIIDGINVKPSRIVKENDIIDVKQNPIYRKLKVLKLLHNRVGAKLVPEYIVDITPAEELKKLEALKDSFYQGRNRGTGRPTKKERRDIDDYFDW